MVSLARSGDRQAFNELVRRRQSWVRNLMRRCCRDETLADDLAQQVFLQAWSKLAQLRQPTHFGPWLKRLAITTWLQHQRRHDPLHDAEELQEPAASQDSVGLRMDLDQALAQLPGAMRLCVVLAYHERMTHAEIVEHTELPLGTVKSNVRRGGEKLKQLLADYAANAEDRT